MSIEIPEEAWVSEVSTSYPNATFRVLSAFVNEDRGVGVVEIEGGGDIPDIVQDMSGHDSVAEIDVLWTEGNEALIQFQTRRPMMLIAAKESKIPVRMPFEIRNGVGRWELTAARERLSELSTVLDQMGISYDIESVREIEPKELLTDKQRNLIETALDMGYYDTPRESSLSEVAEETGIAKSTCSEILHRAEEKIIKDSFG